VKPAEDKLFKFNAVDDLYGFVNVGAKVCEVIPGTLASELGVRPGWYVAAIDGEELPEASSGFCRRPPLLTTEALRERLRAHRADALKQGSSVMLTFWTSATVREYPNEEEESGNVEADTVEELKRILVAKYGSVVAAWNEALDADGSGELSYREFLDACRALGFKGSLKKVFQELDKDGSGVISVNELDPTCAMDFTVGRCSVCTLPNPCSRHGPEEQKRVVITKRKTIIRQATMRQPTRAF